MHLASVVGSVAFIVYLMIYDHELLLTWEGWRHKLFAFRSSIWLVWWLVYGAITLNDMRYDLMNIKAHEIPPTCILNPFLRAFSQLDQT